MMSKTHRSHYLVGASSAIITPDKPIPMAGFGSRGDKPSEGLLSFPIPGVTLALDFPNVGENLFSLLDELDKLVIDFGGRLYPAKDARMTRDIFHASFPEFENFSKYVDPRFSSSFYRRVGG